MVWLLFFEESNGWSLCTMDGSQVWYNNQLHVWNWERQKHWMMLKLKADPVFHKWFKPIRIQSKISAGKLWHIFFFFFFKKIWLVQMNLWQWLIHSIIIKGCSLNNSAKTNCSLRSFFITSISWLFYQWVYWPLNTVYAIMTVCHAHCS